MRVLWVAAATMLVAPIVGEAGSGRQDDAPTFRAETELVALAVTVVDRSKQHVEGLQASDFVVLEDGVEQPLSYFAASVVPLDLTLLVDASASMGDKMDVVRQAVRRLTGSLRTGDRAAIVEFRETAVRQQAMTDDRRAIDAALDRITPRGGTALYTALYVALSELAGRSSVDMAARSSADGVRRQVLVVLSDGDDTSSLLGYEDVLEKARRSGVAIYSVALRATAVLKGSQPGRGLGGPVSRGEHELRMLARETGGAAFFPSSVPELNGIYAVIAEELGRQYVLGYAPAAAAGGGAWRAVTVRLPLYPRAELRTRTGYYADAVPSFASRSLRSARP